MHGYDSWSGRRATLAAVGGMVRVTAVSAGAVDYLLRGCDCAEHDHPDQDHEPEVAAERERQRAAERAAGR